eukprot:8059893-Karenia_brevis.AAC.1
MHYNDIDADDEDFDRQQAQEAEQMRFDSTHDKSGKDCLDGYDVTVGSAGDPWSKGKGHDP